MWHLYVPQWRHCTKLFLWTFFMVCIPPLSSCTKSVKRSVGSYFADLLSPPDKHSTPQSTIVLYPAIYLLCFLLLLQSNKGQKYWSDIVSSGTRCKYYLASFSVTSVDNDPLLPTRSFYISKDCNAIVAREAGALPSHQGHQKSCEIIMTNFHPWKLLQHFFSFSTVCVLETSMQLWHVAAPK